MCSSPSLGGSLGFEPHLGSINSLLRRSRLVPDQRDRVRERAWILGIDDERLPWRDDVRDAAHSSHHEGDSGSHGFQEDDRGPLTSGTQDQHIKPLEMSGGFGDRSRPSDPILEFEIAGASLKVASQRAASNKRRLPGPPRLSQSLNKYIRALLRAHPTYPPDVKTAPLVLWLYTITIFATHPEPFASCTCREKTAPGQRPRVPDHVESLGFYTGLLKLIGERV